jgi:hypothetical protein
MDSYPVHNFPRVFYLRRGKINLEKTYFISILEEILLFKEVSISMCSLKDDNQKYFSYTKK